MLKKQKILFLQNLAKKVNSFSYTSMVAAQELGMEFHIACNWSYASESERLADEQKYGIKIHQVDFHRSPYHPKNRKAYAQLKALIQKEQYDAIHCNTPIGGVLGRIVAKQCNIRKVIYQPHGFHFYKGASWKNWLLYYPAEKLLACFTDAFITINQEDFKLAKAKMKLRNGGKIYFIPGVGVDTLQYNAERSAYTLKRNELGIPPDAFVLISAGELNRNKNNRVIISAMEQLKREDIHYILCGEGELEASLKMQADTAGLHNNVHFLGFRNDIDALYQMSDCFVMPSFREGLSRSMMEAMASGLPCVASRIRGNTDLLEDTAGGFLCEVQDISAYAEKIDFLVNNADIRETMGKRNRIAVQKYRNENIIAEIKQIYAREFGIENIA